MTAEHLSIQIDRSKLSPEQNELYDKIAELRKKTLDEMEQKARERKKNNPEMTPEEHELGTYLEYIEPQVLNAVRTLRTKGYNTIQSGFTGGNKQYILFDEKTFSEFDLPKTLTDFLEKKGVEIYIEPDEIILTCNKFLDIDELKQVWDRVAETMPDLKEEVKTRKETYKKELPPEEK